MEISREKNKREKEREREREEEGDRMYLLRERYTCRSVTADNAAKC